jgi:hypothetical protein
VSVGIGASVPGDGPRNAHQHAGHGPADVELTERLTAMAARLFGTDGVRGLANKDLTAELALDLSVAAAHVLGDWRPQGWMSWTQVCCPPRPSRS